MQEEKVYPEDKQKESVSDTPCEEPVTRRLVETAKKKQVAKTGMTISLAALIATSLMKGRGTKILHIWSGIALIGFSVWHHQLYHPSTDKNKT
jgi:hypothetical protein